MELQLPKKKGKRERTLLIRHQNATDISTYPLSNLDDCSRCGRHLFFQVFRVWHERLPASPNAQIEQKGGELTSSDHIREPRNGTSRNNNYILYCTSYNDTRHLPILVSPQHKTVSIILEGADWALCLLLVPFLYAVIKSIFLVRICDCYSQKS